MRHTSIYWLPILLFTYLFIRAFFSCNQRGFFSMASSMARVLRVPIFGTENVWIIVTRWCTSDRYFFSYILDCLQPENFVSPTTFISDMIFHSLQANYKTFRMYRFNSKKNNDAQALISFHFLMKFGFILSNISSCTCFRYTTNSIHSIHLSNYQTLHFIKMIHVFDLAENDILEIAKFSGC